MKVSFIIPVYNGGNYIEKCINSCLNAEVKDCEIIVVNDGSTDDTLQIVNKMAFIHNTIRILNIENQGLSVARNTGIQAASGDCLIFVDADDWVNFQIRSALEIFEDNCLDVLYYNFEIVFADANKENFFCEKYRVQDNKIYCGTEILSMVSNFQIPHEACRGIYRKQFLKENSIEFIPGLLYEDNVFFIDIMLNARRIMYKNVYCYTYFMHSNSITSSSVAEKNILDTLKCIELIYQRNINISGYIETLSYLASGLIVWCEKRIDSSERFIMQPFFDEVLFQKKKIIRQLRKAYAKPSKDLISIYAMLCYIVFLAEIYDEELIEEISKVRKEVIECFKEIMQDWPLLDVGKNVGIYGSGRNSDLLLRIYEVIFETPKANLYYIDTNHRSGEKKHLNRPVINVNDIEKYDIDEVVICSVLYEKAMCETLMNMHPYVHIHIVYNDSSFITENIFTNNLFEIYLKQKSANSNKRVFVFNTPDYANIGNHLIACAQKKFFEEYFPNYELIEIDNIDNFYYKSFFMHLVKDDDVIVINGGGKVGNLWKETHFDEILFVLEHYKNNKVLVMPQSVYFSNDSAGAEYKKRFISALKRDRVLLFARENISYSRLLDLDLSRDIVKEIPDLALFNKQFANKQGHSRKVGFFIREDIKSNLSIGRINKIEKKVQASGYEVFHSSMLYDSGVFQWNRDCVISQKREELLGYDLIVTDQLHCMIECMLLQIPCIAFDTKINDIKGTYEYVKKLNYIVLLGETDEFMSSFERLVTLSKYDTFQLDDVYADFVAICQHFIDK